MTVTIVLTVIGIIGLSTDNENLGICILLAMCVGLWGGLVIFEKKKKKRRQLLGSDEAMISSAMINHTDQQFAAIESLFRTAGFRNITLVPLRDLSFLSFGRDGKVHDVTIEGQTDFEEGDVYSRDVPVAITYHSKK